MPFKCENCGSRKSSGEFVVFGKSGSVFCDKGCFREWMATRPKGVQVGAVDLSLEIFLCGGVSGFLLAVCVGLVTEFFSRFCKI
jgi:hypothetical protein